MPLFLELSLVLARNARLHFLPNKSIALNIVAIIAGVAFLAFAIAIYDGYKGKVERIIFALTPHVVLNARATLDLEDGDQDDDEEVRQRRRCVRVCREPYSIQVPKDAKVQSSALSEEQVGRIRTWVGANAGSGVSATRVLFEEEKIALSAEGYRAETPVPIRLLGVQSLSGQHLAPQIDLAFDSARVTEQLKAGGVVISDDLAGEMMRIGKVTVTPGATRLKLASPYGTVEVPIAGIHKLGIHSISRNLIVAPYDVAAHLLGPRGLAGPSYVGLTLDEPFRARALSIRAKNQLLAAEVTANSWQAMSDLFDQLEFYRWVIAVTLSLSILVTAINTFVNINILILERVQHIGIMRAMGLGPRSLLAVFGMIGFGQAMIGTVIGYGLGILIGYVLDDYINSLVRDFVPITDAKIAPNASVFAVILAFVALVSVLTCLLGARRALKLDIAENLRGA